MAAVSETPGGAVNGGGGGGHVTLAFVRPMIEKHSSGGFGSGGGEGFGGGGGGGDKERLPTRGPRA